MFSGELSKILTADRKVKVQFGGVYPIDKLPTNDRSRRPVFYVVNTDEHRGPGKHWVVLYLPRRGPPEFFDSLAGDPSAYHRRFGRILRPTFLKTVRRFQRLDTRSCGLFCIYFAFHRCRGWKFADILKLFCPVNLDFNERLVLSYFDEIPKSYRRTFGKRYIYSRI